VEYNFSEIEFEWDNKKSELVKRERGLSFDEIVENIRQGAVLDIVDNREEFKEQKLLILNINNYSWVVPVEFRDGRIRIITAFKSRKFTKLYLGGKK